MISIWYVLTILGAFALVLVMGPFMIPFLLRLKVGQTVRDDGPQSHLKKTGTPTMGGIMILIAVIIPSLFFVKSNPEIMPVLVLTIGMGLVGFLDDYIKVVLKRSLGLKAWQKLGLQLIITAVFCYYVYCILDIDLSMKIPFLKDVYLDLGIFNIPLLFFVVLGTDNATNLTDGLDGLATSVTIAVAAFFGVAAILLGSGVTPIVCAVAGALMGFLMFNVHPARVFMGDTGSLALGGFVAATAYIMQLPLFLILVGIIYIIETLSVIIQVGYFKISHGKRVFKMAPIHHHYELSGWSETKIVAVFTTITILMCLVAFCGIW